MGPVGAAVGRAVMKGIVYGVPLMGRGVEVVVEKVSPRAGVMAVGLLVVAGYVSGRYVSAGEGAKGAFVMSMGVLGVLAMVGGSVMTAEE